MSKYEAKFSTRVDLTSDFRQLVREVDKRNAELARISSEEDELLSGTGNHAKQKTKKKSTLFGSHQVHSVKRDPFNSRAEDILKMITEMEEFLRKNKNLYLEVVSGEGSTVSERQRDKIDQGADTLIRSCNGLITAFKKEVRSQLEDKSTVQKHFEAVFEMLEAYLKRVCSEYSKQKAIRVEKELAFQRLSRLNSKPVEKSETSSSRQFSDEENDENVSESKSENEEESSNFEAEGKSSKFEERQKEKPVISIPGLTDQLAEEEDELSPEEIQLLEQENERLYGDFMKVRDSVSQIENKVVKIAELQEIFTEKVLQQSEEIDLIADNAVATTENIKDGNEEIRKAIQNQASVRVYVLFFLIVMSFSLLFLDWYNE